MNHNLKGSKERVSSKDHAKMSSKEHLELDTLQTHQMCSKLQDLQRAEEQKLRDDVASRDIALATLMQEARQQKKLLVILENELFMKNEVLGSLEHAMAEQRCVKVLCEDLQRANTKIQDLQIRKESAEELLRSIRYEAGAKGDAVEGLVCSLTRQAAVAKETVEHQRLLEAECKLQADMLCSLTRDVREVETSTTRVPQEVFPGVPKRVEEFENIKSNTAKCS